MIIAIDLSAAAKAALERLLDRNDFENASQVVSMALLSYEALHEASAPRVPPVDPTASQAGTGPPSRRHAEPEAAVPHIFQLQGNEQYAAMQAAETPAEPARLDTPPQEWIWGQYNKLLPLKATCRALLNRVASQPNGVDLTLVAPAISLAAAEFAKTLRAMDEARGSRREDAFATAFPLDEQSGRSRIRFETQFVGQIRAGTFAGLPSEFRFATRDEASGLVKPTPEGVVFAILANPILDGPQQQVGQRFSEEELTFLLRHIVRKVPGEAAAYSAIIKGISKGSDSPSTLDQFLRKQFRLTADRSLSDTFLTTQRTGVISRMSELLLLEREREGVSVRYRITARAEQFLAEAEAP